MASDDEGHKTSPDGAGDCQEVGYRKPPKHTRFRPGRSGNPKGRRKGVRNLMTDVKRTLKVPVRIKERGRSRNVSTQEGALMVLREMALGGDARALDRLLGFASRFNNDTSEIEPSSPLSVEDQAILDAYAAEIISNSEKPTTGAPFVNQPPNRDSDEDIEPTR